MNKKLTGVFAPVTTPFDARGEVFYDALAKNMEFYARSRLNGYLALGSNGENKSLTSLEKERVLKTIIEGKGADQVVIAGCIFESTRETIEFARTAEKLGADYILLLPPSYFKSQMTDTVLYKYFTDVADVVDVPCLIYNAPQFAASITLSVDLVKRLADHPNIVGIKDSSVGNIDNYLLAVKERCHVLAGSANFFLSALLMGATGGVLSLGNVFPDLVCNLYELVANKEYERAFALNEKILHLNKAISGRGGVAAVKYAMDLAGLYGGAPRLPLLPLAEEQKNNLKKILEEEEMI
ncbi:Aldolase-type TIM barrel [Moorella glycerini]|uniref:4-hydroxy-tetrahydrodipicolinate synthase n=1 Tax=Neomoorella stamsii TaxID=1266720 RepID=A0A9X7J4Y0_9FIRM|nr:MULTISPECIES: dihydrodipicolinate synthase family protein [Moorella]PRR76448.1 4-hydroxy-tetrahydrodipicolinate synthase [Moorella stamsii]CEP66983.1 Aldolase-type TIM barrel [Moorella glycerini]